MIADKVVLVTEATGRQGTERAGYSPLARGESVRCRPVSVAAIDDIYKRYRDRILRLALRITRNQQDAEDVVQDCFMHACQHLDSFAGRASLSTWIWRIAVNAALMKIRKCRPYEALFDEVIATASEVRAVEVRSGDPSPDQQLLRRELRQALANELEKLKPAFSDVVELHYFQELTVRECARSLGISVANAKGRIFRARLKLRPLLNRRLQRQAATHLPLSKYSFASPGHDSARRSHAADRLG